MEEEGSLREDLNWEGKLRSHFLFVVCCCFRVFEIYDRFISDDTTDASYLRFVFVFVFVSRSVVNIGFFFPSVL